MYVTPKSYLSFIQVGRDLRALCGTQCMQGAGHSPHLLAMLASEAATPVGRCPASYQGRMWRQCSAAKTAGSRRCAPVRGPPRTLHHMMGTAGRALPALQGVTQGRGQRHAALLCAHSALSCCVPATQTPCVHLAHSCCVPSTLGCGVHLTLSLQVPLARPLPCCPAGLQGAVLQEVGLHAGAGGVHRRGSAEDV